MMNKRKSSTRVVWKYIVPLPLFIGLFLVFSSFQKNSKNQNSLINKEISETEKISIAMNVESDGEFFVLNNISGDVSISSYDGDAIKITALKTISSKDAESVKKGISEIQIVNERIGNDNVIYFDSPYSSYDFKKRKIKFLDECSERDCFGYQYIIDYEILIPNQVNLHIENINQGNISVNGLQSDFVNLSHITGDIYLTNVRSALNLNTITGDIKAFFSNSPKEDCFFGTVTGNIETRFPPRFSGKIINMVGDGDIEIDFPVKASDKKHANSSKILVVGNSQNELTFKTVTGSAMVLKN